MSIYPTKEQKLQSAQEGVNMLTTLYDAKVKECDQLQSELAKKDELLGECEKLFKRHMDLLTFDPTLGRETIELLQKLKERR